MKVFIPLFISILMLGCTSLKPKFIKCTKQVWSINNGNSKGTVYHIVIKAHADTTIFKIDSLQITNFIIKDYKLSVLGQSNLSTNYKSGDSVLISFNRMEFIDTVENIMKNKNIIYYSLNKKNRHCVINSIKTLKPLL